MKLKSRYNVYRVNSHPVAVTIFLPSEIISECRQPIMDNHSQSTYINGRVYNYQLNLDLRAIVNHISFEMHVE